jgi:hypothetical protein
MGDNSIETAVAALLSKAGFGNSDFQMQPLSASGNNRVFIVHIDSEKIALKWYFNDAADPRDRLATEFAFLDHAWRMGLRCIPRPIAKDPYEKLALYEFVEGEKIDASKVDENLVQQAALFLAALNSPESLTAGTALLPASEACFSVADHFAMVDARLIRLQLMPVESAVEESALELVKRMNDFWSRTKEYLLLGCESFGLNSETALTNSERCLSPSDFGFHNALLRPDGSVCFIDFEYAGWDDPAKAVGDFFSHPGVGVPHTEFETFMAKVLKPFDHAEQMANRVRLLEPIFQIKWCCIILNEFLPIAAKRRHFADPSTDVSLRKERQLLKATQLFESLKH